MIFVTYYDAVLVGSNSPLTIDPSALAARMSDPAIRRDLAAVQMGSVDDLLAYFVMGTAGARRFGEGGRLNTDDNLILEFSAPESQGSSGLEAVNVRALAAARENIASYVSGPRPLAVDQQERWDRHLVLGRLFDRAHVQYLAGNQVAAVLLAELEAKDPSYAPLRFIREEQRTGPGADPKLVRYENFAVVDAGGKRSVLRIDAVCQFLGRERAIVSFVDSARQEIYVQRTIDGAYEEIDTAVKRLVEDTLVNLRDAANRIKKGPSDIPRETSLAARFRDEMARMGGRTH
jgi:spermidine synthase